MGLLDTIATGITLLDVGNNLYGWVTGHTVSNKLEQIHSQIEQLDRHLFYLPRQEVWNTRIGTQEIIENLRQIRDIANATQQILGLDMIISAPIISPDRLRKFFHTRPEDILFDIRPIRNGEEVTHLRHSDPTLLPLIFSKWGQEFAGFIKVGYLKDYLDCEYKPQTNLVVTEQPKIIAPQQVALSSSPQKLESPRIHVNKMTINVSSPSTKTWNEIKAIIAGLLGVDADQIRPDARFREDLAADSVDSVELAMAFEEKFGIEISDEDAQKLITVNDAYRYIEAHRSRQ